MPPAEPQLHELQFLAPVPRDHRVLVATVQREDATATLVLDETAGILYTADRLWGPLGRRLTAVTDPLAALAQLGWLPVRKTVGRVLGVMISTKGWGEANQAETRLFVDPSAESAPYR